MKATSQFKNGIKVGGKTYEVVFKSYDTQSSVTRAGSLAKQAIQQDGVDLLLASSIPETVNAVASQAEALGTPLICSNIPWEAWYINLGGNPPNSRTPQQNGCGITAIPTGLVPGQDRPQVPLAEDQHPVGDLCPGSKHEPFRISVRARTAGGIFTASMPASARTASNASVNCLTYALPDILRRPGRRAACHTADENYLCRLPSPGDFSATPERRAYSYFAAHLF